MCIRVESITYAATIVFGGKENLQKNIIILALIISFLTISLLMIGSDKVGKTSIDALQKFIIITAIPVTSIINSTLFTAPTLAFKEYRALRNINQR